jgi:hypothetical protein
MPSISLNDVSLVTYNLTSRFLLRGTHFYLSTFGLPRSPAQMSTTVHGQKNIIGTADNFWLFDEKDGFDITHPSSPTSELIYPRLTL